MNNQKQSEKNEHNFSDFTDTIMVEDYHRRDIGAYLDMEFKQRVEEPLGRKITDEEYGELADKWVDYIDNELPMYLSRIQDKVADSFILMKK